MRAHISVVRGNRLVGLAVFGALLLGLCGFARAGFPFHKMINKRYRESLDSVANIRKAADEFRELFADKEIATSERCFVLRHLADLYLHAARHNLKQMPEAIELAEDACDLYTKTFGEKRSSYYDAIFGDRIIQVQMLRVQNGGKEKLPAALQTIDTMEERGWVRKDFAGWKRAETYSLAGQTEKALETYVETLRVYPQADPLIYRAFALELQKAGRHVKAVETIVDGLDRHASHPRIERHAREFTRIMVVSLQHVPLSDEIVLRLAPKGVRSHMAFQALLIQKVRACFAEGEHDAVLSYAKLCYETAPIDQADVAIGWISRGLKAMDMDVTRVNQFLELQNKGPAGPDGKIGTKDDPPNPLKDVASPLVQEAVKAMQERLVRTLPLENSIYEQMKIRGMIYLAIGKHADALRAFRSAYAAASIPQVREGSGLVPRVLKAMDGSLYRANQYIVYQRFGPAGEDGKAGTEDDLKDPSAGITTSPMPADVRNALTAIAHKAGNDMEVHEARGYAYFALGDYRKGFNSMRTAYALADLSGVSLARAIQDLAAAIKAHDGHIYRANRYLDYQRYGAAGPDGKPGTDDDIINPLPVIMKEMQR